MSQQEAEKALCDLKAEFGEEEPVWDDDIVSSGEDIEVQGVVSSDEE